MSEYESPIVEGLNSDVGASRGTAAIVMNLFLLIPIRGIWT